MKLLQRSLPRVARERCASRVEELERREELNKTIQNSLYLEIRQESCEYSKEILCARGSFIFSEEFDDVSEFLFHVRFEIQQLVQCFTGFFDDGLTKEKIRRPR